MIRIVTAVALLGAALLGPATAQMAPPPTASPPAAQDPWLISEDRVALRTARIAFPRRAGPLSAYRTMEFSREGEGIDGGIQYRSSDEAVFATVYIYYPGLADAGVSAFATDRGLHHNSSTTLTGGEPRIVAAGGVEGAAIRRDYAHYRGDNATSAAFIKAERWIVKIRVTGPEARQSEVTEAMEALLAGVQFGATSRPRPAAPLTILDCARDAGRAEASLLPDPSESEIPAHAFLATFDGGGIAATENGLRQDLPSRIPRTLCVSTIARVGDNRVPILRAPQDAPLSIDGRSLLLAILSDSGSVLEVVQAPNLGRHILLSHRIGETTMLGGFDGVPSDAQIAQIISDPDAAAGRVRARVNFTPDGQQEIQVPPPTAAPTVPTT